MKVHTAYEPVYYKDGTLPPNRPGLPPKILTWVDRQYMQDFQQDVQALRAQSDIVVSSHHMGHKGDILDFQSEIAHAAIDTGSALAEAALDAGKQAVARTTDSAAAPAAAPTTTVTEAVVVEPPAPAPDPVETASADDVPRTKAKPLAKALNEVAPKPAGAEHPIASTVPLEAGPQVDLPIVTPAESTPPLRVVTQGGKGGRNQRKK
jgi:hypothetical protein